MYDIKLYIKVSILDKRHLFGTPKGATPVSPAPAKTIAKPAIALCFGGG